MQTINLFEATPASSDASFYGQLKEIDEAASREFHRLNNELLIYTTLAENPKGLTDEIGRISLFSKLSYGFRMSGQAYAWALIYKKLAYIRRKEAMAIANIDEYGSYVRDKKKTEPEFKSSEKTRESYSYISPTVMRANRCEAVAEGMAQYFSVIQYQIGESIKTLRASCYGPKQSDVVGWGAGSGYAAPEQSKRED